MRKVVSSISVAVGLLVAARADTDPVPAVHRYLEEIKPVLEARCYACHGALKQKAGLRVDTAALLRAGADEGSDPVIALGDPDASELIRRVVSGDPDVRMPPEGEPLEDETIGAMRAWIADGAPTPDDERGDDDPRDHWAFQPIARPAVPDVGEAHPIDAFLEAKRRDHGLVAQPEAERTLLLRRLHLDLAGLPPTPGQLVDERPFEAIVDELLAGPQHAERWARHWMDVWRYSDWYGLGDQLRNSQKHLWRWRDWIIDSLHEDKGYDRMILEMLAGDELAPGDPRVVRATGFLARNYYLFNRTTWLDSTIEHTGKAFLGLTLNCAKCHDHKYDPIDMADYYRMRAIFEPHQVRLDPVPGVADLDADGLPRVFDAHPDAETRIHRRGDPEDPDLETTVEPGVPAILASFAPRVEPVPLPPAAFAPGTRRHVVEDRRRTREAAVAEAVAKLEAARARVAALGDDADAGGACVEAETGASGPAFEVVDGFDRLREDLWEVVGEGWEFRDGALHLTRAGRERSMVRLRESIPADFEVVARYTTTGGTTYRSVTFRFDLTDDERNANFVYTSAHEPDPKVQVAHTRNGADAYPAEGRVSREIPIGEPVELRFAVRDRLVNVWLDGAFVLACEVPDRRAGGRFAFSGFDATVAFDSIAIRSLGPGVVLTEPGVGPSRSPEAELRLAEAGVAAARAEQAAFEATVAADAARAGGADEVEALELAMEAARRQAESAEAREKLEVVLHDGEGGDAAKLKAARERLAKAGARLAEIAAGGDTAGDYQPLRAARQALESPVQTDADDPVIYPDASTGRRLMLARWIVSPENPLTARVAVNHVWMRHFGEPLVETVSDFGRQARRPEHLELLDFLAAEFIESGWSLRHLHRLMVTSRAYQATSSSAGADPAIRSADPTNRFYWRAHPRRMESQVVRDSLLHLAGTLDLEVGGPSIDPKDGSHRRSLYFLHSRDQQDRFLSMFDDADHLQCYRRTASVVPQQALALANSAISLTAAGEIAERLAAGDREGGDSPSGFIDTAFLAILGRLPDDAERDECSRFWDDLESAVRESGAGDASPARRQARLVHALLNHNDFVTIR